MSGVLTAQAVDFLLSLVRHPVVSAVGPTFHTLPDVIITDHSNITCSLMGVLNMVFAAV